MQKFGMTFKTERMEKWRRHFKIYRATISIYLDTADFGRRDRGTFVRHEDGTGEIGR